MRKSGVIKRTVSVLLCAVMAFTTIPVLGSITGALSSIEVEADYAISNPRTEEITNEHGDADLKTTWDCVWFGNYPQSDNTGSKKDPIKWRVLSLDENGAFLLADVGLDCKPYNTEYTSITWETCTLRSWLNGDFYNTAFTSNERNAIKTTTVVNDDNPYSGVEGGNDTSDKIFLLSISEVLDNRYGFPSKWDLYSRTRRAKNTKYAKAQGALTACVDDDQDPDYYGNGRTTLLNYVTRGLWLTA